MWYRYAVDPARPAPVPATPLLWQRPWWTTAPALAAGWALLLIYGTLLPFDLDLAAWLARHDTAAEAVVAGMTSPRWIAYDGRASDLGVTVAVSDLITNLALYFPLGVLLRFAAQRCVNRVLPQVALAAVAIAALSWSLECLQALSPSRYPSINDWLANTGAGLIGVVVAVRLRVAVWRLLFWLHRRSSRFTLPAIDALRRCRDRRPLLAGAVAGAAVLAAVYAGWVLGTSASSGGVQWLPFRSVFARPYDVAAMHLLRSGVVYAGVAVLIALPLARRRAERALVRLAAAAAAVAVGIEAVRAAVFGAALDVTEPVLAATVAVAVLMAALLAVDGVRKSCRRRKAQPVEVERRRRRHDYRFAR